jgi:hypothetical protein
VSTVEEYSLIGNRPIATCGFGTCPGSCLFVFHGMSVRICDRGCCVSTDACKCALLCVMLVCTRVMSVDVCIQCVLSRCFQVILECVHKPDSGLERGPLSVQAHKLIWSEPPVGWCLRTSPPCVVCITNTLITGQHMLIIHEAVLATNHARLGLTTSHYVVHS